MSAILMINDEFHLYNQVVKRGDTEQILTSDPLYNLYIPDDFDILQGDGFNIVCLDQHRQHLAKEMTMSFTQTSFTQMTTLFTNVEYTSPETSIDVEYTSPETIIDVEYTPYQREQLNYKIHTLMNVAIDDYAFGFNDYDVYSSIKCRNGSIKAQRIIFGLDVGDKDLIIDTVCPVFHRFFTLSEHINIHHVIQAIIIIKHPIVAELMKDLSTSIVFKMIERKYSSRVIQRLIDMDYIDDTILDKIIRRKSLLMSPVSYVLETLIASRPDYDYKIASTYCYHQNELDKKKFKNIIKRSMDTIRLTKFNELLPDTMKM